MMRVCRGRNTSGDAVTGGALDVFDWQLAV